MDWLNWQCCLASSSKTAPRILIFSIAMGADYSFELISIETYVPQFNGNNKLFLGSVIYRWFNVCFKKTEVVYHYCGLFYIIYFPLCNVRGLWAHFRILPQCYWLLPWTNLAPSIGFPLCQFCQWTFYVSGKKRRVEKATFHEIRKRFFAYFADQIEYLSIWNLLTSFRFWFREMS